MKGHPASRQRFIGLGEFVSYFNSSFGPHALAAVCAVSRNGLVASALVSLSQSLAPPTLPPWIASRLSHLDLNHGSIARYFTHLSHDATAKARTILNEADQVADELGLDDELLAGLLFGLRLE